MARPPKQGLDYYPMDVTFLEDRKFRKVKLKYGYVSVGIYQSLLELVYSDKGYYLRYGDNTKEDVIWEVQKRLQGKHQPSPETIAEVIEDLVGCELFSEYHFESEILTSKRIQSTYYSATVERKSIHIDFEIWMLNLEEMKALSKSSIILQNFINQPNNEDNPPINEDNRSNNPQSKVEESKVNNKRESTGSASAPVVGFAPPSLDEVRAYCEKCKSKIDPERFFNHYDSIN